MPVSISSPRVGERDNYYRASIHEISISPEVHVIIVSRQGLPGLRSANCILSEVGDVLTQHDAAGRVCGHEAVPTATPNSSTQ